MSAIARPLPYAFHSMAGDTALVSLVDDDTAMLVRKGIDFTHDGAQYVLTPGAFAKLDAMSNPDADESYDDPFDACDGH